MRPRRPLPYASLPGIFAVIIAGTPSVAHAQASQAPSTPSQSPIPARSPSPSPTGTGNAGAPSAATTALAERWLRLMQRGAPDRSELSPAMDAAIPDSIAQLLAAQYGPLGAPTAFTFVRGLPIRGGRAYVYHVTFESQSLTWIFAVGNDGKVTGFHFYPPQEGT